jgi:hypothetical protein
LNVASAIVCACFGRRRAYANGEYQLDEAAGNLAVPDLARARAQVPRFESTLLPNPWEERHDDNELDVRFQIVLAGAAVNLSAKSGSLMLCNAAGQRGVTRGARPSAGPPQIERRAGWKGAKRSFKVYVGTAFEESVNDPKMT